MYRPTTSYYFKNIMSIDPQRCLRCLQCVGACPRKVLDFADGNIYLRNACQCAGCLICESQCGMKAITHRTVKA
ncbi:MAG: 4Fe-4S binding protein [Coriobacteriaceae bacterium]|jgi:NAD-dependent dihydropyrimidine dehydrogenase PreA subunit|nr:4Fe-4S binding protein [Coriobacteriaceae bacterium]